jgi:hypothetical protein
VDGGGEARIGFFVTGSDAPKLLEPLKAVLDEMPPFVHLKIMWDGSFPIGLGGDDGDCTAFVQRGAQTVAVKGSVGNERAKSISWINGSVPMPSWRRPGESTMRARFPSASASATIKADLYFSALESKAWAAVNPASYCRAVGCPLNQTTG